MAAAAAEAATTDVVENGAKENDSGGGSSPNPPGAPLSVANVTSHDGFGDGEVVSGVSFSAMVHTIRTLSSPPFLQRGVSGPSASASVGVEGGISGKQGGRDGDGGIPPRLQLAAVAVLRMLLSGKGADYVRRATAAAVAAAEEAGAVRVEGRENEEDAGKS